MNRHTIVALGIAVGLHLPLGLILLIPWHTLAPEHGTAAQRSPLARIRLEEVPSHVPTVPSEPRESRRPETDLLPVDYRPRLGNAPLLHPVAAPELSPVPGSAGAGQSQESTNGSAQGLARVGPGVRRVVYVLDRSVSMALNGYLDLARREIGDGLRRLPRDAEFQVVLYQRHAVALLGPLPARLHPAESATITRAVRALDAVTAEGPTRHRSGMELALSLRPEVIVLLTDEDDLQPEDERAILRLNRGSALQVVELKRGPLREGAFARLARATGGSHRRIASSGE
jgi:hypothetical protein